MHVDIIIPTYKPDETFCLLLQKLREQTFVIHRLILMNTEKQHWEKAKQRYPIEKRMAELPFDYTVCHISKKEFDHGGTRNLGAARSDADVLLFMTQDAVPADEHMVECLVKPFEAQNARSVAVAYARQLPNEDCAPIERYTRQFNYPAEGQRKSSEDIRRLGIKAFFCSDVCAAYSRETFEELGGFESPAIFNEDMFFAAKALNAGYIVEYAADARVVHSHNYSVRQQFCRNFDLAVSQTMHPEIFEQVSSEAEGIRLVTSTMRYLCGIGKPWLIGTLFLQCAGKYAGYFLGKRYHRLSRKQILRCTMNPGYWEKIWGKE